MTARRENEAQPYKSAMQWQVTTVLMTSVVLFVILYIPSEVLVPITGSLSHTGELVTRLGIAAPAAWMLRWVLFAQDHLATGSSSASQFFRHYYVSLYTRSKYDLSKGEADMRWFEYFNDWEEQGSPNHKFYRINVRRTYEASYEFDRLRCATATQ